MNVPTCIVAFRQRARSDRRPDAITAAGTIFHKVEAEETTVTDAEKREILAGEFKVAGVPEAEIPATVAHHFPEAGWTIPGKGEVSSPRLRDAEGRLVSVADALAARAAAAEAAKPKAPTAAERTAAYLGARSAPTAVP